MPSFALTWKTKTHAAQGGVVPESEGRMGLAGMMGPIPPQDAELNYQDSFLFDRGRFRFVDRGERWRGDHRDYADMERTMCFDGSIAYTFTRTVDDEMMSGRIREETAVREVAMMLPVLFAVFPAQSDLMPLDLEEYTLSDRDGEVDGCRCLILQRISGERLTVWSEVWVDPTEEYLIRRVINRKDDLVRKQLDISYGQDSEKRTFPTQWRETRLAPTGEMRQTSTSTVMSHTFAPKFQLSDFQLAFPEGTLVFDERESHREKYVVLPQNQKRIVLDEEIDAGITEDVLKTTETGEPLQMPASRGSWGWAMGGAGLLALLVLMVVFRARSS